MSDRDPFKLRGFLRIFSKKIWWVITSDSYLRSTKTTLLYLHYPHTGRIMMKTMMTMWMRTLRRIGILGLEDHRRKGSNRR
jgi:hypothetical protein